MNPLTVSNVRFTQARSEQVRRGLVGHVSLVINEALKLDGIALRRTLAGRPTLSFPSRRDRAGGDHPYVRPLSNDHRVQIELQVFEALGIERGTL